MKILNILTLVVVFAAAGPGPSLFAAEAANKEAKEHEGHDHAKEERKPKAGKPGKDEHDHAHEISGHKDKHDHEGHEHAKEKGVHKDEHGHDDHEHAKEKAGHEGHDHAKGGHKDEHGHEGHDHAKEKDGHKDEHGHDAHGHGEAKANVGPGKAVEAFEEGGKLTLSAAAVKRLGLKSSLPSAGGELPRVALVQSEGKNFVFVDEGGRKYERRAVELGSASGKKVKITSGLRAGEKVVTSGASSLRVAELDLMAGDEVGHDH